MSVGSDMVISLVWLKTKGSPVIDLKTRPVRRAPISAQDEARPAHMPAKQHGRQAAVQAASSKPHTVN
jgi:hypothetical protein